MMNREILKYCLDSFKSAEIDKCQTTLTKTKTYEMNVEGGNITLFRTNFESDLNLIAIKDHKKGSISLNKTNKESIDEAITTVIELVKTAQVDEAHDISFADEAQEFSKGDLEPDLDKMYHLLNNFNENTKKLFPQVLLLETRLDFRHITKYIANSNGVDLKAEKGFYTFVCMFSSKDEEKSSSFNYTDISMKDLEKELLDCASVKDLLKQSVEQLDTKPLEGKFTGDIIMTPECLNDFINFYINTYISDIALISGTSILKDKLEDQVTTDTFTLHSYPASEEISNGYSITQDGFVAENVTIIDKGILKSFMLSQYGANKTQLERAKNSGDCYVVEAGDQTYEDMVKSTDKGVLVARFSGGYPSTSGDFSGVAKNSYYIENGEIKYPISETMIMGNLYELFNNITAISKERIDHGNDILPWVKFKGVTISGR